MPHCKLPECPIAKTGRCLENRGADCPNLLTEGEAAAGDQTAPTPPSQPTTLQEPLFSGLPLDIKQARQFSGRGRATVVAVVGLAECGKTSLIARLHQMFLGGPIAGYRFMSSRTLLQFEEMNWRSTIESGENAPRLERSPQIYDNSFLHFTVRGPDESDEIIDVLLNDVSGETVKDGVSAQSVCDGLMSLARADHLVIVADGNALADVEVNHNHAEQLLEFIERILQSGQIGRHTILHLVISKKDKLKGAEAVADKLEADFRRLFEARVGEFHSRRIAARPWDGTMPTEEQIAQLFATWLAKSLRYAPGDYSGLKSVEWSRDFGRFGAGHPTNSFDERTS